ncbi:hypothetical protein [Aquimarina algiphila]|uniref:hypothetical protein n=1 Tax=Aquimarina algiphila TaxID=2047982 RepID=UPI00249074AA|nr:hypothetical protein [Aquimarina algiphila]
MNIYITITSILSVFFLIVVGSLLIRKYKERKLQKSLIPRPFNEMELRKKGFKPYNFFPFSGSKKSIQIWSKSYKDAKIKFQNNIKGGMYGGI